MPELPLSKSPVSKPGREEFERRVMVALVQKRLPRDIQRLDPKLFQVPILARIAEAMVTSYRVLNFLTLPDLKSRLGDEEKKLIDQLNEEERSFPHDLDPIAVLAGQQELPPAETKPATARPQTFCSPLTEFEAGPREWLWPGRVELGQLTLVGGESGSGKSLVACDLAARTTAGRAWPDGAASLPGSVLLVASGDDVSGLMRPRLEAAGAEVGRIYVLPVDPVPPVPLARDRGSPFKGTLKAIEAAIAAMEDCRLVVIDPLRLMIGRSGTTVGGDPAARLELLAGFARREHVAVLGVAAAEFEDRRRNTLGDALKLAGGACAATVWQVVRHPQLKHVRLFLPAKTTRSSDLEGLAFTVIEEATGERVQWKETHIAADLLEGHSRGDAAGWLRQALASGPLASKEILKLGGENGYTPRMLHYAKAAAGVAVTRDGFGHGSAWQWILGLPAAAEQAKTA